jgi:seryl-tRNA synthetase
MHDLKFIEQNTEEFKNNLKQRGFDISEIDKLLSLNDQRKKLIQSVESTQAEVKKISKEVGMKKKAGEDATDLMNKVGELKSSVASDNDQLDRVKSEVDSLIATFPNLLEEGTPSGSSEDDNVEVNKWGEPKEFTFDVKDHVEIGESLGQLDFEAAGRITGARFVVYKGHLARLERALANFFLDFILIMVMRK